MTDRRIAAVVGLIAAALMPGCADDPAAVPGRGVFVQAFTDLQPGGVGQPPDTLTAEDAERVALAAAESVNVPNMAVAVVDRVGNLLLLWNKNPASQIGDRDNAIATSMARTAAYLSHSQAPLTTRTTEFLNTFHFPSTLSGEQRAFPPLGYQAEPAPFRVVDGVLNTPLGPLYEIQFSNRGADYTADGTAYNGGKAIPRFLNPDGTEPSPGFTPLPGGMPLYKNASGAPRTVSGEALQLGDAGFPLVASATALSGRRLVGGVGVYVPSVPGAVGDHQANVPAQEFASFQGSLASNPTDALFGNYAFPPVVPFPGAVFLVGILLPFIDQPTIPAGLSSAPGAFAAGNKVFDPDAAGQTDPDGYLIGPVAPTNADGLGLSVAEVRTLIRSVEDAALRTQAAIRFPAATPCQMVMAITDANGRIQAAYRMTDATLFSLEISITKARNAFYFSNPASRDASGPNAGNHPLFPAFAGNPTALAALTTTGIAVTARSLGFLAAPAYPPVIDGSPPGPLVPLRDRNREAFAYNQMGFAPPSTSQSGIIFFPGSAPLYRQVGQNRVLIGGIGVSGDGVDQDDFVTDLGIKLAELELGFDLEPPRAIRCDNFSVRGVAVPYFRFPQNPGG